MTQYFSLPLYDTIILSAVGIMSMYVCMHVRTFCIQCVPIYVRYVFLHPPTSTRPHIIKKVSF
jgi:hypothetical protein